MIRPLAQAKTMANVARQIDYSHLFNYLILITELTLIQQRLILAYDPRNEQFRAFSQAVYVNRQVYNSKPDDS